MATDPEAHGTSDDSVGGVGIEVRGLYKIFGPRGKDHVASVKDGMSKTARQALGYKELLGHIEGGQPLDEALDVAKQRTRRFVRRQHSWFRRDPRIEWFDLDAVEIEHVLERVRPLLR